MRPTFLLEEIQNTKATNTQVRKSPINEISEEDPIQTKEQKKAQDTKKPNLETLRPTLFMGDDLKPKKFLKDFVSPKSKNIPDVLNGKANPLTEIKRLQSPSS